jgi:hypothetical protein
MPDRYNPNSALHWLDAAETAVEHSDVRVPETLIVDFDFEAAISLIDAHADQAVTPAGIAGSGERRLIDAAETIGWPIFVRSDLSSAKDHGIDGIQAQSQDDIMPVINRITNDAAVSMMRPTALLLREWINIEHRFTANDGLPIGTELRLFAGPEDVLCSHYYWPEDAIDNPSVQDWKQHRTAHEEIAPPAEVRLAAQSAASNANVHDTLDPLAVWSIDIARTADGSWYLIDMALAADSWHPDCSDSS